jgi:hypothetical protein
MTTFKPMDAVSDDGDVFFAQNYAPIYRAANLVIDEMGRTRRHMQPSGPILFVGRETFWVRRRGDVWRH